MNMSLKWLKNFIYVLLALEHINETLVIILYILWFEFYKHFSVRIS